eukprot:scaffold12918_cov98-Isochrysis_galbana.AAC.4
MSRMLAAGERRFGSAECPPLTRRSRFWRTTLEGGLVKKAPGGGTRTRPTSVYGKANRRPKACSCAYVRGGRREGRHAAPPRGHRRRGSHQPGSEPPIWPSKRLSHHSL